MAQTHVQFLEVFPAHEPPPLPPFGHPLPRGGGEGRGEGAVGWFKGARRAQSSGRSILGERAVVRAGQSPVTSDRLLSIYVLISQARNRAPAPRPTRTGRRRF